MIKILFILIGMIPMGLSVMIGVAASHETEEGKVRARFYNSGSIVFCRSNSHGRALQHRL